MQCKKTGSPPNGREPVAVCGLPFDIVVHVHQVVDGVLDGAAGHCKVDHIHSFVVVQHGVDQAAGKGVAAAHAVQNVKGVQLALEGVTLVCPLPI